uniref:YeeE/YedE family protein n=1 Tax=Fervidicoccus fontis TaxID=683846 RepID=A0A7J3ZK59_9CREN
MSRAKMGFKDFLEQRREKIFGSEGWNPVMAGALIGLVNILSYIWVNKPFTVYTGFLNWGQHIHNVFGLGSIAGIPKLAPLLEPTSVGDIGVILGAMFAAVLSNEFAIRKVGSKVELLEAIAGGVLMALGVSMAFGCNWGGFLSAITSWSLHGFAFLVGALIGGYIGLRYVSWKAEKVTSLEPIANTEKGSPKVVVEEHERTFKASTVRTGIRNVPALTVLALLIAYYAIIGSPMIGGLFIGLTVGVILQRARFCFATAFRDLFNGPENARALGIHKGIAIAILVGSIGAFALKYKGMAKEGIGVAPVYMTNVVGGLIFTFGTILAGGCASGILWRAGEGHVRAWIAIVTTVLTYPIFYQLVRPHLSNYPRVFIPHFIGWVHAFTLMVVFVALYVAFVYYLEYRYRASK